MSERELMAAMVAQWNTCPFCVGAHSAIAVKGIDDAVVAAVLDDYRTAPISERLRATLVFLERVTKQPEELVAGDAHTALQAGVTREDLEDAAAVAAVFNVVTRNANALDFDIPSAVAFDKAAAMLLKRGYA